MAPDWRKCLLLALVSPRSQSEGCFASFGLSLVSANKPAGISFRVASQIFTRSIVFSVALSIAYHQTGPSHSESCQASLPLRKQAIIYEGGQSPIATVGS